MKPISFLSTLTFTAAISSLAGPATIANDKEQIEAKIQYYLDHMTIQQKLDYIHGVPTASGFPNSTDGSIAAIPKLGLPEIRTADASNGIRVSRSQDSAYQKSTSYPAALLTTATWNPDLARSRGIALAHDAKARGFHVLLGPGMNIYRVPVGSRNSEYSCGEDPYLGISMLVPWIQAMQHEGVVATSKHFVANDEDYNRLRMNVIVDERTLREIYLRPFEAAVKLAHTDAVMCSYNKINGTYSAVNRYLDRTILRQQWKFDGIFMSDWGAVGSGLAAANAGMDLEMPGGNDAQMSSKNLYPAYLSGQLPRETIDEKIANMIRVILRYHFQDHNQWDKSIPLDNPLSTETALNSAREGMILLKNEVTKNQTKALPLDRKKINSIAVVGKLTRGTPPQLGGAAYVKPIHYTSEFDGITKAAGKKVRVDYFDEKTISNAALAKYDAVVVSVGFDSNNEHESNEYDRTYDLPKGQDDMVRKAAACNRRTIVVLHGGGGMNLQRWINQVPGLIHAIFPVQDGGQALAEILFGDVNPSGKLPFTFEKQFSDNPAYKYYPAGEREPEATRDLATTMVYGEKLFVGYRGFDKFNIHPLYPFGFGLSYTRFGFDGLTVAPQSKDGNIQISFYVSNIGDKPGAEVAQLYVGRNSFSMIERPVRELKGFKKVLLQPGQKTKVTLALDNQTFAIYDPTASLWKTEPGQYKIWVGSSSRDLNQSTIINVKNYQTWSISDFMLPDKKKI
jgi:beta-glucosidase